MHDLKTQIREWGRQLGFAAVGISAADTGPAESGLRAWLEAGYHGEMDYMAAHGSKRCRPEELVPGTRSVIVARMNYQPVRQDHSGDPDYAAISCYALGRDYHKLLRQRLQRLAERMSEAVGPFAYRVFTDSAPVMEAALAQQAGLGWRGKHTLLIHRQAGSYFFLGEIYTGLALPADSPLTDHCGTCTACIDACPTQAIVAPGQLDARRCISYLTIELKADIPQDLRPALGNRIYGCDDCQSACPWNRFAPVTQEADFAPRQGLDAATLLELFAWEETEFEQRLAGSPIRRIGHERWLRNLAVALGNVPSPAAGRNQAVISALRARADHPSAQLRRHIAWALERHGA